LSLSKNIKFDFWGGHLEYNVLLIYVAVADLMVLVLSKGEFETNLEFEE
jgi:hypothetical protein